MPRIKTDYKQKNVRIYPTEYNECKSFWQWAAMYPDYQKNLIKHCNERIGGGWFTIILKAIGLRKGLPDYQYCKPNHKYHGLWIEMKRIDERGKKKREEQNEWIDRLMTNGYYATYCYGAMDAIKVFLDYVNNRL